MGELLLIIPLHNLQCLVTIKFVTRQHELQEKTMLSELVDELKKYDRAEIAYRSGVSIGTVNNILSGSNKDPKLSTLTALQNFVESKKKESTQEQ